MRKITALILSLFAGGVAVMAQEIPDSIENMQKTDSVATAIEDVAPKGTRPSQTIRNTTPVDVDDQKPRTVLHYYDKHGDPLKEPVRFLATLDTVTKVKEKSIYPLFNGVDVGINFGDLIFMAFGQQYKSFDVWADVSLYNRFFPVVEAGVGMANSTPDNNNYTYHVSPSFYAKVGLNYNFLYKSSPDYQLFLGVRAAYSRFSYELRDVTINSSYWGESQNLNITGLNSHALWGEAVLGIKVKIVSRFSLGWTVRYHYKFWEKNSSESASWYIPGYGSDTPITFTVSAIWRF
jgi:hypothetical protein